MMLEKRVQTRPEFLFGPKRYFPDSLTSLAIVAALSKKSLIIQIENDVPQPQELVTFGLSMTKRAPISSSE